MNRYDYQVIESFCEAFGVTTYGISVHMMTDTSNTLCISIKDISSDCAVVTRLAAQCQRLQLDPIHLLDVIEYFLS